MVPITAACETGDNRQGDFETDVELSCDRRDPTAEFPYRTWDVHGWPDATAGML